MVKIQLIPDKVLRYLNDDFETLDLKAYYDLGNVLDKPKPVVLKTPSYFAKDDVVEMTLTEIGDDGFLRKYVTRVGEELHVKNCYPDKTYVCRYVNGRGDVYEEEFATDEQLPCMLDIDGLNNVRDFGGWKADGGVLRQKTLYRGSELNLVGNHGIELTEEGRRTLVQELKIKTDIDLRNDEESLHITESPIGKHVGYYRKPILGYMDMLKEEFNVTLKEIFELLADRKNYPVYIHCWAGADRTGTLLAVLKAALGVSYEDITRDHEISTFSILGLRGRCAKEFTYVEVFEYLRTTYPAPTLQESAKRYLFEKVGVREETFVNICAALLETGDKGEKE